MATSVSSLFAEARHLSEEDRAELIDLLDATLAGPEAEIPQVLPGWAAEVRRRAADPNASYLSLEEFRGEMRKLLAGEAP